MLRKDKTYQNEYRTGGPIHHRSYGALFTVGIFLLFVVTGMLLAAGLLGLRVSFLGAYQVIASLDAPEETMNLSSDLHMEGFVMDCTELGITCQSISEFCENYYELPQGIYVVRVEKHTLAAQHGVLPGDILVRANGSPLRLPAALQNILAQSPRQPIVLDFIRNGKTYSIMLTPET